MLFSLAFIRLKKLCRNFGKTKEQKREQHKMKPEKQKHII